MNLKLKMLCRVIRRRLNAGETLEVIFEDYPRLTPEEILIIETEFSR